MAALVLQPDGLAVRLNRWERLATFQRDFTIPWDHITHAEAPKDIWPQVRGWRWPGLGIPHVVLIGRMRFRGGSDFCVLLGTKPGVALELRDEPYQRLVATTPAGAEIVHRVTQGR